MSRAKTVPAGDPTKQPKSSRFAVFKAHKGALLLIFWVAVLLLVGFISFNTARSNALAANKTAEKALTALKASDANGIYQLGTNEFKNASDQTKVKAVIAEWNKVIVQTTDGKPTLVSKQESTKDGKSLTTLLYKYTVKPGKSKINQKELYVQAVTQKVGTEYKLSTFTIDFKVGQKK